MNHNLALWLTFMSALIIGITVTSLVYREKLRKMRVRYDYNMHAAKSLSFHQGMDYMSRMMAQQEVAAIEDGLNSK